VLDVSEPRFVLAVLVTVVATVVLIKKRRQWPWALGAWTAYVVVVAPNAGFVRVGHQLAADRYAYLSTMSLVVIAAAALIRWDHVARQATRPVARLAALAVSCACALILMVHTRRLTATWHDSLALWSRALAVDGGSSPQIHENLATAHDREGRYKEATLHFKRMLELAPDYALGYANLGAVAVKQGDVQAAAPLFDRAIELDPDLALARYNRGVVAFQAGRIDEAIEEFSRAIKTEPGYVDALTNLGTAYSAKGDREKSIEMLHRALRFRPDHALANYNVGMIHFAAGRWQEALAHFEAALAADAGGTPARERIEEVKRKLAGSAR
jgi:tetratricopeptide (TPR) repeat protein